MVEVLIAAASALLACVVIVLAIRVRAATDAAHAALARIEAVARASNILAGEVQDQKLKQAIMRKDVDDLRALDDAFDPAHFVDRCDLDIPLKIRPPPLPKRRPPPLPPKSRK